jgi:hypothetical protein
MRGEKRAIRFESQLPRMPGANSGNFPRSPFTMPLSRVCKNVSPAAQGVCAAGGFAGGDQDSMPPTSAAYQ